MARANKRIKVGDTVKVLNRAHDVRDSDAGGVVRATGRVLRIFAKSDRVIVEGVNKIKRHRKGDRPGAGEIVEKEAPIHLSNVMLVDQDGGGTRTGIRIDNDGRKTRFGKRTENAV